MHSQSLAMQQPTQPITHQRPLQTIIRTMIILTIAMAQEMVLARVLVAYSVLVEYSMALPQVMESTITVLAMVTVTMQVLLHRLRFLSTFLVMRFLFLVVPLRTPLTTHLPIQPISSMTMTLKIIATAVPMVQVESSMVSVQAMVSTTTVLVMATEMMRML
ncbi:hypothetical protein AVENLUH5627_03412 [Acinetobacter venetianus]|uniref:Uncharacterized protein n=1 Tax=Acinetobacter venetianus TaxID=52133 RepID=A0A150HJ86_9GAMM|nr:hypothetical protein AVENLUH5627_03412 [Acinetobacter venetianus]